MSIPQPFYIGLDEEQAEICARWLEEHRDSELPNLDQLLAESDKRSESGDEVVTRLLESGRQYSGDDEHGH